MKTISFPENAWNVIAVAVAAIASAAMLLYTFVSFGFAMSHLLPAARRETPTLGAGIFDPRNFDDAGQDVHRRFRRACMFLALVWALSGVVVIAFPL